MNNERKLYYTRYKFSFEPRILLKNYCCKCGSKLTRKIKIVTYIRNSNISSIFDRKTCYIKTLYYCKCCHYYISYFNQRLIKLEQKKLANYILPNSKQIIKEYKINDKNLLKK